MSVQSRYVNIALSVLAWSGVLVVATYRSHTPGVFGQDSWGHIILLGLLVWIAMMAEHLANDIVSYWTKKSSRSLVASQSEECMSRARSRVIDVKAFAMGLAQTFRTRRPALCVFLRPARK